MGVWAMGSAIASRLLGARELLVNDRYPAAATTLTRSPSHRRDHRLLWSAEWYQD